MCDNKFLMRKYRICFYAVWRFAIHIMNYMIINKKHNIKKNFIEPQTKQKEQNKFHEHYAARNHYWIGNPSTKLIFCLRYDQNR